MFKELVHAADRFRIEGKLPPAGYKPKFPKWIVNIEDKSVYPEGPFKKEIRTFSPDRQRSGTPSSNNLKPFLLLDDARYVMGKAEKGKEKEAALLHEGFVSLLRQALEATGLNGIKAILEFLSSSKAASIRDKMDPKDLVAIKVKGEDLSNDKKVQAFWAKYLSKELVTEYQTECGICGHLSPVVRILPREVVILGQKCQVSSFNKTSFLSLGKEQTTNAPACFNCSSSAIDALDYVIRSEQHHKTLWFKAEASSLENQLGVYWLEQDIKVKAEDRILDIVDIEALLGDVLNSNRTAAPPAHLSQIQRLLSAPWTANREAFYLDEAKFNLAVLSANKGRLVVREWLKASVKSVKDNLCKFLEATRMISANGDSAYPVSVGSILDALASKNPNITRGLVRTAYTGVKPPSNLHVTAAERLGRLFLNEASLKERNRRSREKLWDDAWPQALASAIKLGLYYDSEEVKKMAELNVAHRNRAYLCGCLLAILEEAQQVATYVKKRKRLDTTIVNRFYGGASSAPKGTFGRLMSLATVAHLPDAGKEINVRLEEVMTALRESGGFPKTLNLEGQADFALGFYHQRSTFRSNRNINNLQGGQK